MEFGKTIMVSTDKKETDRYTLTPITVSVIKELSERDINPFTGKFKGFFQLAKN